MPIPSVYGSPRNAAPHPSAGRAADTFPQWGRHFFPKTSTILTKRLQPAPPAHTVVTQLVRGDFVCWSSFHCFFWAAGPMPRSSWPGGALPTGRCSQRAGPASAFCKSWLLHRCRWPGPPPWAQSASAGWSWRWGQSAAACCTPRCGTIPPSGGMWPGLSARGTPFTGFCSAGGSSLCCGA